MNLKFFTNFLLIKLALNLTLIANQNEDYNLINDSYKSFLKENSENKKEWYNKPCEYIDYLQKQFLKSENKLEVKEYAKLLELALQDGLYFKYQKQSVSTNQFNKLSVLFQKAKVISNIGNINFKSEPDSKNDNIYLKTFYDHFEQISQSNFKAFSWKNISDPNYVIDNFWISLQNKTKNNQEKATIDLIKNLPLYQRDFLPQYFLNKIMGCAKKQNYRILELFKKPLEDEYLQEMLENFEDINPTAPYFFYNPDVQKKFPSQNNNKCDVQQINDNSLKAYIIEQQYIKIDYLDDLKNLDNDPKKFQNASSLDLNLFKGGSIDDLKAIFDRLKKYNFYEIKLFITFHHHEFADLITQFLNNFKNLYNLKLDLNNRTEKSINIQSPKDLKKLRTIQIGSNGFFDFSNIFKKLSESKYLDTILLFNHQIHNQHQTNLANFQEIYGDISKILSLKTFHIYDQNLIKNEEDVVCLGVLLDSLVNLEDLELLLKIGNSNPEPYHQLFNTIVKNKNLTDLSLKFDFFDRPTTTQFSPQPTNTKIINDCIGFLENFNKIERLSLQLNFEKKNENIQSLTNLLKNLSKLYSIDINFTYNHQNLEIPPEIINDLTNTIGKFQNLQNLNLVLPTTNQQENQAIATTITNLQHLKHIVLHTQTENNHDCQTFLRAIGNKKELQYLYLSFSKNNFDSGFYNILLEELQNLKTLEYLNLTLPMIRNANNQIISDEKALLKTPQYQSLRLLTAKLNTFKHIYINFLTPPATMEESKKYDKLCQFANKDLRNVISQKKKAFYQLLPIRNTLYKTGLRTDIANDILSLLHKN
jgi:hypothetical protein